MDTSFNMPTNLKKKKNKEKHSCINSIIIIIIIINFINNSMRIHAIYTKGMSLGMTDRKRTVTFINRAT